MASWVLQLAPVIVVASTMFGHILMLAILVELANSAHSVKPLAW